MNTLFKSDLTRVTWTALTRITEINMEFNSGYKWNEDSAVQYGFILRSYGLREAMHSLNPEKQEGVIERTIQKSKTDERV